MDTKEFNQLSKEEKKNVKFKDFPKLNKFAIIFVFVAVILLMATCIGTCVSSDSTSTGIDSVHLEVTAKFKAEEAVKLLLKAPSTAQFPSENQRCWLLPDSTVVVKGAVDAQNTFGAMIRNSYYAKFKWQIDQNKKETWALIDIKLE